MNKEKIEIMLKNISTPTGITYSGDVTICNSEADLILDYIDNQQHQLDIANKKLEDIKDYLEYETLGMNNPFDKRTEELKKILSIIGGE